MRPTTRRSAFTLIELLTVMAIIVLLIGILTPALTGARNRAKQTAVKAQINAISVGLEAFHGDEGEYPASNAVLYAKDIDNTLGILDAEMTAWEIGTISNPLQGAHLIVDAMVGRDFLGFDPMAPGVGPIPGPTNYNRWDPANDRREPYIPSDGIDVTSVAEPPEDGDGVIPAGPPSPQQTIDNRLVPVFRDKFGWPLLYYRASSTATPNTPIMQTPTASPNYGDGVYDGLDNEAFTSYSGNNHKINEANLAYDHATAVPALPNNFAEFIRSLRSTTYDTTNATLIDKPRPVKSDRFILLSAGRDGIYGNLDDVANFDVLSTER